MNHSSFSNPVIQDGLDFWGELWHSGGTFKFPGPRVVQKESCIGELSG